jgi:hypothetical protein
MNTPELRALVESLHTRLQGSQQLDSETRALLESAVQDIEQALDRPASLNASIPERLESLATSFEAEHPTIVVALRQLVDSLVKAGI